MKNVSKHNAAKHNNAVGGIVGRTDHYRTHLVISEIWAPELDNDVILRSGTESALEDYYARTEGAFDSVPDLTLGAVRFAVVRGEGDNAKIKGYMTAARITWAYSIRNIESCTLPDDAFYEIEDPFSTCMLDLLSVDRLDAILVAEVKAEIAKDKEFGKLIATGQRNGLAGSEHEVEFYKDSTDRFAVSARIEGKSDGAKWDFVYESEDQPAFMALVSACGVNLRPRCSKRTNAVPA